MQYVIKWNNKLQIGDGSIDSIVTELEDGSHETQIVMSFKSIYSNRFTIFVIKKQRNQFNVQYKHTSYQLWES